MRLTATLVALFVLGCTPMGETPGIRLGGTSASTPADFAFVQETELIQLEAQGLILPRVVNIWGIGIGEVMYVWSDPGTGWSKRVEERPDQVRVRVGDNVYEVSASKVDDLSVKTLVAATYQAKYAEQIDELYGQPVTAEDFEVLYRLTPRN